MSLEDTLTTMRAQQSADEHMGIIPSLVTLFQHPLLYLDVDGGTRLDIMVRIQGDRGSMYTSHVLRIKWHSDYWGLRLGRRGLRRVRLPGYATMITTTHAEEEEKQPYNQDEALQIVARRILNEEIRRQALQRPTSVSPALQQTINQGRGFDL